MDAATKVCPYCAERIAAGAVKCRYCHSMLPPAEYGHPEERAERNGVKIPILISAIGNVLVGLAWVSTCFLFFLAILPVILCVFEFTLYSQADDLYPEELASRARTTGIFEIVVGVLGLNAISFVCGIIVIVHAAKLERFGADA